MISLIIPTYLAENQKYLDLALDSIANLNINKELLELIVVASNGFHPVIKETGVLTRHAFFEDGKTYAEAINIGVRMANPDSEFYFLLSDDIILTKNCLKNMIELSVNNKNLAIIQAISQCDNTRKFQLMMGFKDKNGFSAVVETSYRYEDLSAYAAELMNAESVYPIGVWFNHFLCFYAVLIPAQAWKKIGFLDEGFKNGQEDIDYCIRARRENVPLLTTLNSVVWHFSGKTADTVMTKELRDQNQVYFKAKWGKPVEEFLK